MLDAFSFPIAPRQRAFSHPFPMGDSHSPNSSRESTPGLDNGYHASSDRRFSNPTSIAELSQYLDQHTLTPPRPNISRDRSTPRASELTPPLHSSNGFSSRVCRQRQSISRLQCSSAHLSRISALVEDMLHTSRPLYDSSHPSAPLEDSGSPPLSPDEIAPMPSYFSLASIPSSCCAANGNAGLPQHSLRQSYPYKIDKDLRHGGSREGTGQQPMVKKRIRMRKNSKMLKGGEN